MAKNTTDSNSHQQISHCKHNHLQKVVSDDKWCFVGNLPAKESIFIPPQILYCTFFRDPNYFVNIYGNGSNILSFGRFGITQKNMNLMKVFIYLAAGLSLFLLHGKKRNVIAADEVTVEDALTVVEHSAKIISAIPDLGPVAAVGDFAALIKALEGDDEGFDAMIAAMKKVVNAELFKFESITLKANVAAYINQYEEYCKSLENYKDATAASKIKQMKYIIDSLLSQRTDAAGNIFARLNETLALFDEYTGKDEWNNDMKKVESLLMIHSQLYTYNILCRRTLIILNYQIWSMQDDDEQKEEYMRRTNVERDALEHSLNASDFSYDKFAENVKKYLKERTAEGKLETKWIDGSFDESVPWGKYVILKLKQEPILPAFTWKLYDNGIDDSSSNGKWDTVWFRAQQETIDYAIQKRKDYIAKYEADVVNKIKKLRKTARKSYRKAIKLTESVFEKKVEYKYVENEYEDGYIIPPTKEEVMRMIKEASERYEDMREEMDD